MAILTATGWYASSPYLGTTNVVTRPTGPLVLDWDEAGIKGFPVQAHMLSLLTASSSAYRNVNVPVYSPLAYGSAPTPTSRYTHIPQDVYDALIALNGSGPLDTFDRATSWLKECGSASFPVRAGDTLSYPNPTYRLDYETLMQGLWVKASAPIPYNYDIRTTPWTRWTESNLLSATGWSGVTVPDSYPNAAWAMRQKAVIERSHFRTSLLDDPCIVQVIIGTSYTDSTKWSGYDDGGVWRSGYVRDAMSCPALIASAPSFVWDQRLYSYPYNWDWGTCNAATWENDFLALEAALPSYSCVVVIIGSSFGTYGSFEAEMATYRTWLESHIDPSVDFYFMSHPHNASGPDTTTLAYVTFRELFADMFTALPSNPTSYTYKNTDWQIPYAY